MKTVGSVKLVLNEEVRVKSEATLFMVEDMCFEGKPGPIKASTR
jgi:hypothetical protein